MPVNGMYLTSEDYIQWQDYFSKLILAEEKLSQVDKNNCGSCSSITNGLRTKNITFVVTEGCSLQCTYCYQVKKNPKRMTKEVAKAAVDMIFDKQKINGYYDFDDSQGVILDFIGGEPLLEVELIDYIVEYFKFKAFQLNHPWATNYAISISTNGVNFLDKKVQDFLMKNNGKVSIGITIDGNKELHDKCRLFPDGKGSYDIVEKAVKRWVEIDNKPQTKITLCPENVMYLNNALKNIWSLGVNGAFANCVFEEGWTVNDARILYSEMKKLADYLLDDERYKKYYCSLFDESIGVKSIETKNWCGGNGEMLAIGTDGTCYPCIRFMDYCLEKAPSTPIGNIYDGLEDKTKQPFLKLLCSVDMITQSDDKCRNCLISQGCSLCTGYNYDHFGTPNKRATYICVMHQARVLACRYYFQKLYNMLNIDKEFKLNISDEWALEIISNDEYKMLVDLGGGINVM